MQLIVSAFAIMLSGIALLLFVIAVKASRRRPRSPRLRPKSNQSPSVLPSPRLGVIQGKRNMRTPPHPRAALAVVHSSGHSGAALRDPLQGYLVAGHQQENHYGLPRTSTYRYLASGQPLRFVRERDRTADPNAICLYAEAGLLRGVDLGYLRGPQAKKIARQMDRGAVYEAKVLRVTPGLFGHARRLFIDVNLVRSPSSSIRA